MYIPRRYVSFEYPQHVVETVLLSNAATLLILNECLGTITGRFS